MNLEGSLASFGLPDVLALLATTGKTGQLRLHDGDVTGTVVLKEGLVVAAASDDAHKTLARRLIASGLVDHAALEQALAQPLDGAADVADVADVAERMAVAADLAPESIAEIIREQVVHAVYDLLRWGEGDFAFEVASVAPARTHTEITAADLVAEAQDRLAGLPELTDRLPDPSTILTLPLTITGTDERPAGEQEWAALALVDGRRTLAEALELADRGAWQTLTTFAGLIERGLLVEAGDSRSVAYRASLLAMLQDPVEVASAGLSALAAPPVAVAPLAFAAPESESALEPPSPVDSHGSLEPVGLAPLAAEPPAPEFFPAPEPVVTAEPVAAPESFDGIDDALLQQLMAGVRAL